MLSESISGLMFLSYSDILVACGGSHFVLVALSGPPHFANFIKADRGGWELSDVLICFGTHISTNPLCGNTAILFPSYLYMQIFGVYSHPVTQLNVMIAGIRTYLGYTAFLLPN